MKKLIYLASPYSHQDKEVEKIRFENVCKIAGDIIYYFDIFVFSPIAHSHSIVVNTEHEMSGDWEYWKSYDTKMINLCDEIWILQLDGWQDSKGIKAEIEIAKNLNKPIYYIKKEGTEWNYTKSTDPIV